MLACVLQLAIASAAHRQFKTMHVVTRRRGAARWALRPCCCTISASFSGNPPYCSGSSSGLSRQHVHRQTAPGAPHARAGVSANRLAVSARAWLAINLLWVGWFGCSRRRTSMWRGTLPRASGSISRCSASRSAVHLHGAAGLLAERQDQARESAAGRGMNSGATPATRARRAQRLRRCLEPFRARRS